MIASCDNPKSRHLLQQGEPPQRSGSQIPNPKWKDAQALKDAVGEWSDRIKVQVKQIQLRPMKRKWASISTTGRLTLNTELLDLPKELGEFAIVHELVHLLVPNHGKVFKCFMSAYLPDWEKLEKQLQNSFQR